LIVAHKSDLLKAVGTSSNADLAIHRVKTILERELEKRRASQADGVGVESLGAEDEGTEIGGLDCNGGDGVFKFSEWDGGEIAFIGTSVGRGAIDKSTDPEKSIPGDGLSALRDWMGGNMWRSCSGGFH
jgi:signal recognition particle receptor subunit beta